MLRIRRNAVVVILVMGLAAACSSRMTAQEAPDDAKIASEIEHKLYQDSSLKQRDIHVESNGGVVTLSGKVKTNLEKSAAERIASHEPGVTKVVSSLTVVPPKPAHTAPSTVTLPSGTVITVQMIDGIDSKVNQPGQEFAATVAAPVAVGNRVVIPQNSDAKVRLVNAKQAGHIKGSSELTLELVSLTINGTAYDTQSGSVSQQGASRGKQTGKRVALGALAGGVIGGIAGGGKGVAIGAGAGAATGGVVQAVTKGPNVKVPSEAKLDFTLKSPLSVAVKKSGT